MNDNECCLNYIKETVDRIDKMQKRVIIDENNTCIFCESSLYTNVDNTIPVSFNFKSGEPVTAKIGPAGANTSVFRIEALRCNRYVTLRLLQATVDQGTTTITATPYTTLLDLDAVSQIQCFEPNSVTLCNQNT